MGAFDVILRNAGAKVKKMQGEQELTCPIVLKSQTVFTIETMLIDLHVNTNCPSNR